MTGVVVSPSPASVKVGATVQMIGKVSPSNADNQVVSWTSSNTAIATIDATTGLAKGVAAGTATITGKTSDGAFVDTETITVTAQ